MQPNYSRLWLFEAHARVVDRIASTVDRGILQRAQLDLIDACGWPSFVVTHQCGLKIPDRLVDAYRAELATVMAQAAEALVQASEAPACTELQSIWHAALQRLPLPSCRMLFSQQTELTEINDDDRAVVAVAPEWLPMVTSRADVIEQALGEAIGRSVALTLVPANREVQA